MFGWFGSGDLDKVLNKTKTVKIDGVRFTIRKINVLDHLAGNQIMLQTYDTYQVGAAPAMSDKRANDFISQILVAGVVLPRLSHKADEAGATHVDRLWVNQEMVIKLYMEIMKLTYGKKKLKSVISSIGKEPKKSTP